MKQICYVLNEKTDIIASVYVIEYKHINTNDWVKTVNFYQSVGGFRLFCCLLCLCSCVVRSPAEPVPIHIIPILLFFMPLQNRICEVIDGCSFSKHIQ